MSFAAMFAAQFLDPVRAIGNLGLLLVCLTAASRRDGYVWLSFLAAIWAVALAMFLSPPDPAAAIVTGFASNAAHLAIFSMIGWIYRQNA